MSRHTPGPWGVNIDAAEVGQANPPHFTVVQFSSHWTKQEQADARLIATAPEMLEILRLVVRSSQHDSTLITSAIADKMRAIVAKAEGR